MWDCTERAFQAYGKPLDTVTSFKYLGQVIAEGEDDWSAVVGNFKKVRKSWSRLTRILGREGADPGVSRILFKAIVQAMLLFGSETWVLTPSMEQSLGIFQHRVARRITGRHPKRREEGVWEYPPLASAM